MVSRSIAVIIVNWNGKKDTIACLGSLARLLRRNDEVVPVVVDNGSRDNSVAAIQSRFPRVVILALDGNQGFTGANNRGIQWAMDQHIPYVWILNNDTLVDRRALKLFDVFADSTVGAAASKIYFAPGYEFHKDRYKKKDRGHVLWYAGGVIDWANMYASHRGVDEIDSGQYNRMQQTDFLTGCSLAVPTAVMQRVGMFDNRYFAYLEDVDLSLRIVRAGFQTLYVPSSVVWHKNASSTGGPGSATHEYYLTRNRLLLGMTYAPIRTKVALLREAMREVVGRSPARRRATRDALLARYGRGL